MKRLFHLSLLGALLALSAVTVMFLPEVIWPSVSKPLANGAASEKEAEEQLKHLTSSEIAAALERETAAYLKSPLDRVALQNIALLNELKGDKDKAVVIATALADLSRRSPTSQLPVIQVGLATGKYADAFDRLDGVLRARPEMAERLFPAILAVFQNDDARLALAKVLAREPPWRKPLVDFILKADEKGALGYALFQSFRKAKVDILDSEKRALLVRMVASKQYDGAYFLWLDFLSQAELLKVKEIYDGGFDLAPRRMYFDWTLPVRKNAKILIASRPGKSQDRVLAMDFFADREGGQFAYQYLRLAPGHYTLVFEYQAEGLKTERGLVWRVACVEEPKKIGESPAIVNDGLWSDSSFTFDVPQGGCDTQYLSLEPKSSAAPDLVVSGQLLFDNFRVAVASAQDNKDQAQ